MSRSTLHHLLPRSTIRVVTHFLLNPERRMHFRALKEHTRLGTGALQRELKRLEAMGLVQRTAETGRVYYEPIVEHSSWRAFRTLVREHADPVDVVRAAITDIPGIHAAFVFGSTIRGETRPDSDVDLFLVGEDIPLEDVGRATMVAASLLDREIDVIEYTPLKLTQRLSSGNAFVKNAVSGPKAWLIGSEAALRAA